jgi:hypothetical protein
MLRRGNSMPSNSLDARSCFASYHFDPVQCDRSMLFADRTFDGALTCCMAPPPQSGDVSTRFRLSAFCLQASLGTARNDKPSRELKCYCWVI